MPCAIGGDEVAHVFDDAEDGGVELLEHSYGADGVIEGDLLWSCDDYGAGEWVELAEGKGDVAGAGGEIDDEVIEIGPVGVVGEELLESAVCHGAAPAAGFVGFDEGADGDGVDAVVE